jgi:hypothetical protein
MSCIEGGLWPLMWMTLIICITVYNCMELKRGKGED